MFFDIFFILFFMLILMILLSTLLSLWMYWSELVGLNFNRESMDVYECGFDSKDMSRLPFSLRFFLMMMFFILLDIEVCLLLQFPFEFYSKFYENRLWFWLFLIMLALGIIEEFRRGFLNWKN